MKDVFTESSFKNVYDQNLVSKKQVDDALLGLRWLEEEEAKRLKEPILSSIINAESLNNETSREIDPKDDIYLAGAGSVVQFCLSRKGTETRLL
jgi:hypothetical protein